LSSSIFFCAYSASMALTFYSHNFYVSLLSCSSSAISSYSFNIIYGETVWIGFRLLDFSLCWISFCSSYFTFYCFLINCSWFFRKILSESIIFSLTKRDYYFIFMTYFFKSSILSSNCYYLRMLSSYWSRFYLIALRDSFYYSNFSISYFNCFS
jgi:hypothetical protein